MRVFHKTQGWEYVGDAVALLPAGHPLDELQMLTYYGLGPQDRMFTELAAASNVARLVLLKDDTKTLVVIPVSDDVTIEE